MVLEYHIMSLITIFVHLPLEGLTENGYNIEKG